MHLLHLLPHRLNLLIRGLDRRVLTILKQLRINGLGKPFRHLLRARPIHVLDEQVARHFPQVRVALKQVTHCLKRLLPLGHVAWPGRDANVVLAD